jgi:hypothetical protein
MQTAREYDGVEVQGILSPRETSTPSSGSSGSRVQICEYAVGLRNVTVVADTVFA